MDEESISIGKKRFTFAELFAGCGGISLGLKATGFELAFANELSGMAAETFCYNLIYGHRPPTDNPEKWYARICSPIFKHGKDGQVLEDPDAYRNKRPTAEFLSQLEKPTYKMFVGDIKKLVKALATAKLRGTLHRDFTNLDLLAGGPPCQSFSLAGRREKDNKRNSLFESFAECAWILKPKVILFENVFGIIHPFTVSSNEKWHAWYDVARLFFSKGYMPICTVIKASNFGVPQDRKRFIMICIRKDLAVEAKRKFAGSREWEDVLNALDLTSNHFKGRNARVDSQLIYRDDRLGWPEPLLPSPDSNCIRSASQAIDDIVNAGRKDETDSVRGEYSVFLDVELPPPDGVQSLCLPLNHEHRCHSTRTKVRFKVIQLLQSNNKLPSSIDQKHIKEEHIRILFENKDRLILTDGRSGDMLESVKDVEELLEELYSKKHSQRMLSKDKPAPGQVSIPDDFVHYDASCPRTLTVREIARLQSFPDWFVFRSKATTGGKLRSYEVPQYTQVGNAVPPLLAKQIGNGITRFLESVGG